MRIIITGLIATYPLGGLAWDYLHYIIGLLRLGHQVLYLEDTGRWFYDPVLQTYIDNPAKNLNYLAKIFRTYAPDALWTLRDLQHYYWGLERSQVKEWCQSADIFLNLSGCASLRNLYIDIPCKIYLDSDPAYSQSKIAAVRSGTANQETIERVNTILAHDYFFTFAENIHNPDCTIPTNSLKWHPTHQPIVLDWWLNLPITMPTRSRSWTTVMSWQIDETPPIINHQTLGGKDLEFPAYFLLPERLKLRNICANLEIAISGAAPHQLLKSYGWQIIDGYLISRTPAHYRDYISASMGEWSVAKQAYVATRSGWFSCRTACYLASGKPAIVQDTAWTKFLPTGTGLFGFNNLEEAVFYLEKVSYDYAIHADRAREIAREYFDANQVLGKLLDQL